MTTLKELNIRHNQKVSRSRAAKWGWGLLLLLSALLALNGVGWFLTGPSISLASIEQDTGMSVSEFRQAYPTVADSIAVNARQVAIWFMSFGILALLVALEGFRRGSRWAWYAAWVLVAAPAAVGLNELVEGGAAFGLAALGLGAIGLLGQILAGREVAE